MLSRVGTVLTSMAGGETARNAILAEQMDREEEMEARISGVRS